MIIEFDIGDCHISAEWYSMFFPLFVGWYIYFIGCYNTACKEIKEDERKIDSFLKEFHEI